MGGPAADAIDSADLAGTGLLTYTATFHNAGGAVPPDLQVTLPASFRYLPGSSALKVNQAAPTPIGDPDVNGVAAHVAPARASAPAMTSR